MFYLKPKRSTFAIDKLKQMPHSIDKKRPIPFTCEQCAHFIEGTTCKAFDTIPIDIIFDAERHNNTIDGQKGNYVFTATVKRQFIRSYKIE